MIELELNVVFFAFFSVLSKTIFRLLKKTNLNNYLPVSIQYYCPIVQTDQNSQFYLSGLSRFTGSGSGILIHDLDSVPVPAHSFGSMGIRIRIHNTVINRRWIRIQLLPGFQSGTRKIQSWIRIRATLNFSLRFLSLLHLFLVMRGSMSVWVSVVILVIVMIIFLFVIFARVGYCHVLKRTC